MNQTPLSFRERCLAMITIVLIIVAAALPSIHQYANYHNFADQREIFGLHYFSDVVSNLLFLVAGIWGLIKIKQCGPKLPRAWRFFAIVFFAGFILTFLGSSWYHLSPDNHRLVVDRLGMAVIFSGLLGLAAGERISTRAGTGILLVLLFGSIASLWIWVVTENFSPWAVVQAGGMILVLWLACLKPNQAGSDLIPHTSLSIIILWYALAKVCELLDHNLFIFTHSSISGHSLKHLIAAFAAIPVLHALHKFNKK